VGNGRAQNCELYVNMYFPINVDKETEFVNTHSNPFGRSRKKKVRIHKLRRPGNEKKVISAALEEIRRSFIYMNHCGRRMNSSPH
jgi:hypothetical protein